MGAAIRHSLDPSRRTLGIRDRLVQAYATRPRKHGVGDDTGRRYFMALAAASLLHGPVETHYGAHVTDGCNSMGEPQLEHVLGRRDRAGQALQRITDVNVGINKAR